MANFLLIMDGLWDSASNNEKFKKNLPDIPGFNIVDRGIKGIFKNTVEGRPVDSLNCISKLLGVPEKYIPNGRAYMEALEENINIDDSDIILRCNIITTDENMIITSNSSNHDMVDAGKVFSKLNMLFEHSYIRFYQTQDYRGLAVVKNHHEYYKTLIFQSPHQNIGKRLIEFTDSEYGNLLNSVMKASQKIIREDFSEYGSVSFWSEAEKSCYPDYSECFDGSAVMISGTPVVNGIAKAMNIDVLTSDMFTGDTDTDLSLKLKFALYSKCKYKNIIIHINGADEPAHRQDFDEKLRFITKTGREFLKPLLSAFDSSDRILICSDHTCNSEKGCHGDENQPFWLYHNNVKNKYIKNIIDGKNAFSILQNMEDY